MGAVRATTWERINRRLLGVARDAGVETGERVRIDSTVTGTHMAKLRESRTLGGEKISVWNVDSIEASVLSRLLTPRSDNVIDLASRERPGRRQLTEQLFTQHAPAVRLFLRGRSVPQDQVEDVVQELFARLLSVKRLEERMTDASGSVRSFLLTSANNLIVDGQRKRQVRNAYAKAQREVEGENMDECTPERIVAAQLELKAMRAVILDLPLNWRVALVLQRFRNMSYEEIALHMGVSVRQVERYLRRAARRINKARQQSQGAGELSC